MFVLAEFRDRPWCERIRASMDRGRRSAAEVLAGDFRIDGEARRAWEVEVDETTLAEVDATIREARPRISEVLSVALTHNEGPSLLRYEVGGFYGPHVDCLDDESDEWPRRISVIVFLTTAGDSDGGTLRLHPGDESAAPVDLVPSAGTLVAFPSGWLHEVLPVTRGVRDSIVDWLS